MDGLFQVISDAQCAGRHAGRLRRASGMSTAEGIAVILTAVIPMLVAEASLLWFTYRRGMAAGAELTKRQADERMQAESKAKIEVLEHLLAETRAEVAVLQRRRKRSAAKREHTLAALS
jgi:hypothetical protein